MFKFLRRVRRDESGATIIEMAVLLPVLLTMLIGIMQAGLYLQAQNAIRGVAGEMSRFMTVESQRDNHLSDDQIRIKAMDIASSPPYMLRLDDLDIRVENETTQSMDRVRKINLAMSYNIPNVLGFDKIDMLTLNYTRSVFVPGADLPDPDAGTGGTDTGTGGTGGTDLGF